MREQFLVSEPSVVKTQLKPCSCALPKGNDWWWCGPEKRRGCELQTQNSRLQFCQCQNQGLAARWSGESLKGDGLYHLVNLKPLLGLVFWSGEHQWGCRQVLQWRLRRCWLCVLALKLCKPESSNFKILEILLASSTYTVFSEVLESSLHSGCLVYLTKKKEMCPQSTHPPFFQHSKGIFL